MNFNQLKAIYIQESGTTYFQNNYFTYICQQQWQSVSKTKP